MAKFYVRNYAINKLILSVLRQTLAGWVLALVIGNSFAQAKNGFNLSNAIIPVDKILHGGPAKEGIPAIDKPKFIKASQVKFLKSTDTVIGLHYAGKVRAYPISILNWHEIVNDNINGDVIVVSYCPLCGTALTFKSQNKVGTFGVSGLLYNSDVLLYDRKTQSLWSQILAKAISGKRVGEKLSVIPTMLTSWQDWKDKNPNTTVLSTDTGFIRDYTKSPYTGYELSSAIYFPIEFRSKSFHPKSRVLGLEWQGKYKAYLFSELAKAKSPLIDQFNGMTFIIDFDATSNSGTIKTQDGKLLPALNSFWFAWYAFHSDTKIFQFSN